MYQFLCGFVLGVFVGTRYNLSPYVDSAEFAVRRFLREMEQKAKAKTTPCSEEETSNDRTD